MRITTTSRYGVRALFDVAYHGGGQPTQIKDISRRQKISQRYLEQIFNKLLKAGDITTDPLTAPVAAVSCGIYAGQPVLDLDYPEDSEAGVDGNFIMTGSLQLIEVQMSAEGSTFSRDQMNQLMDLAEKGVGELVAAQKAATA